jgi:dTDP-4-amino-4,6-dideoxygalactose transaminase
MGDEALAVCGGRPVRARPWPRWPRATSATVAAVTDVLESSRWALSGPFDGRVCYERRFARAFADFHEVPYCTPTANGTGALTIALQALGVGRGDEVLVPGMTWVACGSAVASIGAVPVLVDVDADTLTMSPDAARAAMTERTAAIMVVHPFCSVADLDALTALAEARGVPLLEDCAQAHGARWRGRPVGTFGAAGCFSMQQSKLLTSGEGGAAITGDGDLYDRLEQLRCDGRRFASEPAVGRLELVEVATVQGRNLCLSELQAAVLLDGLGRLREENELRADRARQLRSLLADVEGVAMLPEDPRVTTRTYYNLVLRFDPEAFAGCEVDAIARALAAELGTMVNPVYVPLNRHRLLCPTRIARGDRSDAETARLDTARFSLPNAERARRTCATLTHPVLLDDRESMEDVAAAIRKVQRRAGDLARLPAEVSALSF